MGKGVFLQNAFATRLKDCNIHTQQQDMATLAAKLIFIGRVKKNFFDTPYIYTLKRFLGSTGLHTKFSLIMMPAGWLV